jgi:hypothetical protein
MTLAVTIPMFRKADPRSVIWSLSLRYTHLIRWARYHKKAISTAPLTPASLASFAGLLLRSELLAVYMDAHRPQSCSNTECYSSST